MPNNLVKVRVLVNDIPEEYKGYAEFPVGLNAKTLNLTRVPALKEWIAWQHQFFCVSQVIHYHPDYWGYPDLPPYWDAVIVVDWCGLK